MKNLIEYYKNRQILTINADTKTVKGLKKGYLTGILYLAPQKMSGIINTCAHASLGCIQACLNTAGRGKFTTVQKARLKKTKYFAYHKKQFLNTLIESICKLIVKAENKGLKPVVRLNGTSDIPYENLYINLNDIINDNRLLNRAKVLSIVKRCLETTNKHKFNIFELFPEITFYDYTKSPNRKINNINNYSLTFSRAEDNEHHINNVMNKGQNVAVVFKSIPKTYKGFTVINGDETDLRFLDPKNKIVGLLAKGEAKTDTTGFTVV